MYVIILKKKKKEELKLVLKQLCQSYRGYSADRMGQAYTQQTSQVGYLFLVYTANLDTDVLANPPCSYNSPVFLQMKKWGMSQHLEN